MSQDHEGNNGEGEARQPSRPHYDVCIEIDADAEGTPYAWALVKMCFDIVDGQAVLGAAETLAHDMRDKTLQPRLRPDSDFWPHKALTDVVVRGSAMTPGGQPASKLAVDLRVGAVSKSVLVFGDREILWNGGTPSIDAAAPFTELPMTWQNAYGGCDFRTPVPNEDDEMVQLMLTVDHPGLYPRNGFGRGYLVAEEPIEGMMMPNLEDPRHLLRPDNLIVKDPTLWYQQPRPACFDWTNICTFPRYLYQGMTPWYPAPGDEQLTEVRDRLLPPNYMVRIEEVLEMSPAHPLLSQGAAMGLTSELIVANTPISVTGMHPQRREVRFVVPPPPEIHFHVDNRVTAAEPVLHHVVFYPNEERFFVVYGVSSPMHRKFIAGIHKHIPVGISVGREEPVPYVAPPTALEEIEADRAAREASST